MTLIRSVGGTAVLVVLASSAFAGSGVPPGDLEIQSLDGSGNNLAHPTWGQAETNYLRAAPVRYADGIGVPVAGPNARYLSNRVFNDSGQRLLSGRRVSQWATVWGQFLDHTFGLRADSDEAQSIPFDPNDPLEERHSDLPVIPMSRSAAGPGTGTDTPREQTNLVSSYVDAWAVYGGTPERLEWLREGPVDGDLRNNGARLLMPGGLLPRRDARGDADAAPEIDATGGLEQRGVVAGDTRANENIALTAVQTIFAREHNRIVSLLPPGLTEEQKFQVARRVVIATQQYITYEKFLPALGVRLDRYRGYNPLVNASLGNEFATVGYRAHSMVRGDFVLEADAGRYPRATLDDLRSRGATVTVSGDGRRVRIALPPALALFNPDLVETVQLGPLLAGLGRQAQLRSDELVDGVIRDVQLHNPPTCTPPEPGCLTALFDVAAIDVERGRDHGMPSYNELRAAYGLPARASFREITGEGSESFPADPELTAGDEINDPSSLDFVRLFDAEGRPIPPGSAADAVSGVRRTPLAARLKAVYGSVSAVDAFTGMLAEQPVRGSEFGELQLSIWRRQFEALRDGDRFHYLNDPGLTRIKRVYGIDYRHDLADLIALNTDIPRATLADNVFFAGRQ